MRMRFHHLNLCSSKTPAMDAFYQSVLDLKPEPSLQANRIGTADYPGHVAFLTDGATQFHLSDKDLFVGFRRGQMINPLERGHIAFRTDDIDAVKRRLEKKGIPFFRLRRLGHERLVSDLLLRSRWERRRGAPGSVLRHAPAACDLATCQPMNL